MKFVIDEQRQNVHSLEVDRGYLDDYEPVKVEDDGSIDLKQSLGS